MVGKRIDVILAKNANNNNTKNGSSYFSPIVVPVVSSFKRIYKTRLSRNAVFKGKPLHTIEESTENSQTELNLQNLALDQNGSYCEQFREEGDSILSQVHHLFNISENQDFVDHSIFFDKDGNGTQYGSSCHNMIETQYTCDDWSTYLTSPSASLMQQFELTAKVEAAICIQQWYRQARERKKFLQLRQAAIVIQRHFREKR